MAPLHPQRVSSQSSAAEGSTHLHSSSSSARRQSQDQHAIPYETGARQELAAIREYLRGVSPTACLRRPESPYPGPLDAAPSPMPMDLYGLPPPQPPPANACSVCRRWTDLEDDDRNAGPILLCDGCDGEFHFHCLRPPLSSVPDGDFFCWDCAPTGTTAGLQDYLSLETRSPPVLAANLPLEKRRGRRSSGTARRRDRAVPRETPSLPTSELTPEHVQKVVAALREPVEGRSWGAGGDDMEDGATEYWVGKPLELFLVDQGNERIHSGRIVDVRTNSEKGVMEHLVRFPAGADYRKTPLSAWIVLEEHAVTVGFSMVCIEERKEQWYPAMLQLRSARALALQQRSRVDSMGPERPLYRTANPKREKITAWTRIIGIPQGIILRDMRSQAVPFAPDQNTARLNPLAMIEWHEQKRVREWWRMKQMNPLGYRALSSRDEYDLEPLIPINQRQDAYHTHPGLCPLVARGLDRLHIVSLLARGGPTDFQTKDVASTLSCRIVSLTPSLLPAKNDSSSRHSHWLVGATNGSAGRGWNHKKPERDDPLSDLAT